MSSPVMMTHAKNGIQGRAALVVGFGPAAFPSTRNHIVGKTCCKLSQGSHVKSVSGKGGSLQVQMDKMKSVA